MSPLTIDEFRLTLIAGETVPAPIVGAVDPGALPRPYVVRREDYGAHFDRVLAASTQSAAEPAAPWPSHATHGFWTPYLEDQPSLLELPGRQAYRALVPLRVRVPVSLPDEVPDARYSCEGFLYPWAAAVVVTALSNRAWTDLRKAAGAAHEIRGPLNNAGAGALRELRLQTFGDTPGQRWASEPFSVHAVVRGSGQGAELSPDNEAVQRYLHAVTSFSRTWETDALPPVTEMRVAGRRTQPPEHIVYGRRRGRAIWAPAHFTRGKGGRVRSISCQYRNMVLASIQAESLAALTRFTAERLRSNQPLDATHRVVAKRAVSALGRMYLGRGSYRSGSVRAQISANEWLPEINYVRLELELDEIAS